METLPDDLLHEIASALGVADALALLSALRWGRDLALRRPHVALDGEAPVDVAAVAAGLQRHAVAPRSLRLTGRSLRAHSYVLLRGLGGALGGALTRLDLTGVTLGTLGLAALERAELPRLAELIVRGVFFTGAATAGFAAAPPAYAHRIRKLDFVGTNLSRRWRLAWFSGLSSFAGRLTDPDAIVHVASWAHLTELRLDATRVCSLRADVPEWRSVLAALESLTLVDCDLLPRPHLQQPPEAVLLDVLLRAPALRELQLRGCAPPLDDALMERTLPALAARVRRAAARARPTPAVSAAMARAGAHPWLPAPAAVMERRLQRLAEQQHQQQLWDEEEELRAGAQPLQYRSDALPAELSREPVHMLVLEPSDRLGDVTLGLISEALGGTLRHLRLGPCSPLVTDAGLEVLAASCPLLERLELPFSAGVGAPGVTALARSRASTCGRLKHVNLSRCGLRSSAPLCELALHASGLRELFVRGCHAAVDDGGGSGGQGAAALAALAARGCSVRYDPPPPPAPAPACSSGGSGGGGWCAQLQHAPDATAAAGGCAQQAPDAVVVVGAAGVSTGGGNCLADGSGGSGAAATQRDAATERVACPRGCGQAVRPADSDDHEGGVCTHARTACVNAGSGCAFTALRGDTAAHSAHLQVCPAWLVCCGACGETVPRAEHAAHARRHWCAMEGDAA